MWQPHLPPDGGAAEADLVPVHVAIVAHRDPGKEVESHGRKR
jgi:hypothetical protein